MPDGELVHRMGPPLTDSPYSSGAAYQCGVARADEFGGGAGESVMPRP